MSVRSFIASEFQHSSDACCGVVESEFHSIRRQRQRASYEAFEWHNSLFIFQLLFCSLFLFCVWMLFILSIRFQYRRSNEPHKMLENKLRLSPDWIEVRIVQNIPLKCYLPFSVWVCVWFSTAFYVLGLYVASPQFSFIHMSRTYYLCLWIVRWEIEIKKFSSTHHRHFDLRRWW